MDLPPTTDVIRLEIDGPVVTVTLDRAPKYNAMNVEMIEGLISVLSWVKEHLLRRRLATWSARRGDLDRGSSIFRLRGDISVRGRTFT